MYHGFDLVYHMVFPNVPLTTLFANLEQVGVIGGPWISSLKSNPYSYNEWMTTRPDLWKKLIGGCQEDIERTSSLCFPQIGEGPLKWLMVSPGDAHAHGCDPAGWFDSKWLRLGTEHVSTGMFVNYILERLSTERV